MLRVARGLSVLGLLLSAYLTVEHYTGNASLVCSESATVNCALVTSSRWSTFLGLPVALLGLLFFVAMTASLFMARSRLMTWLRLLAAGAGVGFVVYLVWAELFRINAICLWCTGVHVVTVALFVVLVFQAALDGPALVDRAGEGPD